MIETMTSLGKNRNRAITKYICMGLIDLTFSSDMGSIPFCQFLFQSIPFGQFQFHIKFINSNSIPIQYQFNTNSIPIQYQFFPNVFTMSSTVSSTMSRYSEYILGIPTPSSLFFRVGLSDLKKKVKLICGLFFLTVLNIERG